MSMNDEEKRETKSVKEFVEDVLLNKDRVQKQKQIILDKIKELKEELNKPTVINDKKLNSFSIEDIENSVDPKGSRADISKKLRALTKASELPIYSDKEYMNSIHEYLAAIKPEIQEIEKEQWELISTRKRLENQLRENINNLENSYLGLESRLKELLKVADLSYPRWGYDKRNVVSGSLFWGNSAESVANLIDRLLGYKDGITYGKLKDF